MYPRHTLSSYIDCFTFVGVCFMIENPPTHTLGMINAVIYLIIFWYWCAMTCPRRVAVLYVIFAFIMGVWEKQGRVQIHNSTKPTFWYSLRRSAKWFLNLPWFLLLSYIVSSYRYINILYMFFICPALLFNFFHLK